MGTRRHTTEVGLFRLVARDGRVTCRRVDTVTFPATFRLPDGRSWSPCENPGEGPQLEGLVVDEATRTLYAAQEDVGLWRLRLAHGRFAGVPRNVERTREFGVPARFDPATEECTVSGPDPGFGGRIAADTVSTPLPGYPHGLLVVQDGDNTPTVVDGDGEARTVTNFEFLDARVLRPR